MTKLELWDTIKSKYSHLENYCTIELVGIEDESPYFHPRFILDENKMNIFYLKHVRKTGLPKLKYLRWFCFGYLDIVKYYWFLIAGIASVGVKK